MLTPDQVALELQAIALMRAELAKAFVELTIWRMEMDFVEDGDE